MVIEVCIWNGGSVMIVNKERFDKIVKKYNDFKALVSGHYDIDYNLNIKDNAVTIYFNNIMTFDDDDIQIIECMGNCIVDNIIDSIYMQATDVYEEAKYPFINGVMQAIEDSGYDKEEVLEFLIGELQDLEKQDRPMVTTSHKF